MFLNGQDLGAMFLNGQGMCGTNDGGMLASSGETLEKGQMSLDDLGERSSRKRRSSRAPILRVTRGTAAAHVTDGSDLLHPSDPLSAPRVSVSLSLPPPPPRPPPPAHPFSLSCSWLCAFRGDSSHSPLSLRPSSPR
jgi:hypothetical protein